jgi:hypothetical protein
MRNGSNQVWAVGSAAAGALQAQRSIAPLLQRSAAPTRWRALLPGAFSLALLASGCAGYRLGPTNGEQAGARSIQVNPFVNQTIEPRLSEAITQSIRKQLQQDGTYRLNSHDDADIIVTGTITDYQRIEISFNPSDTLTARDYRVRITAHITARERVSGRVLLNRDVSGRSTLRVGSDLPSAERQAVPLVAADLARNATALLVDGVW